MKAIEYAVPLVYRNENAHLVDALPYIDQFDAEDKKQVDSLIAEEAEKMREKDYLRDFPEPQIGRSETIKLAESVVHAPRSSEAAYLHNINKYYKLKLAKEHSEESLKRKTRELASVKGYLENSIEEMQDDIKTINLARQNSQAEAKEELLSMQKQYIALFKANALKSRQCKALQSQISAIQVEINK